MGSPSENVQGVGGRVPGANGPWLKMRGALLVGIACVTSPCCTPLIVPLILALLAGTPAAIWLSAYIGWAYGAFTVISIASLVLGFRWLGQKHDVTKVDHKSRQPVHLTIPETEKV